ncbi:MAG: hypothetical protein IKC64_03320 [Clostridia bacterium]|nr:hypothetical protein [Clostridia bacterium]
MKKFLQVVFNVFWVITVGLISTIESALLGALCCITVIGIPLGLQHFKFIKLVFAPAGKRVITRPAKHPVMNSLWFLFGGFICFLSYFLLGAILLVTIIGIPLGLQMFKIAKFNLAPFGAEIINENEFPSSLDNDEEFYRLEYEILADPDRLVTIGTNAPTTAREYLGSQIPKIKNICAEFKKREDSFATTLFAIISSVLFLGLGFALVHLILVIYNHFAPLFGQLLGLLISILIFSPIIALLTYLLFLALDIPRYKPLKAMSAVLNPLKDFYRPSEKGKALLKSHRAKDSYETPISSLSSAYLLPDLSRTIISRLRLLMESSDKITTEKTVDNK